MNITKIHNIFMISHQWNYSTMKYTKNEFVYRNNMYITGNNSRIKIYIRSSFK